MIFPEKNELQMIPNVVSCFGEDDTGDTVPGLVDAAGPFFGKITSFCHQNNHIFEKYY